MFVNDMLMSIEVIRVIYRAVTLEYAVSGRPSRRNLYASSSSHVVHHAQRCNESEVDKYRITVLDLISPLRSSFGRAYPCCCKMHGESIMHVPIATDQTTRHARPSTTPPSPFPSDS